VNEVAVKRFAAKRMPSTNTHFGAWQNNGGKNHMKKYNITVNGVSYEVEVEELGSVQSAPRAAAPAPRAAAPAAAPKAAAPAAAPKAAPAAAPAAGEEGVSAPMPGTILDIKVAVGDSVSAGDVLIILEAMKMENEIMAPASGKVVSINTNKGASVNSGDVLVVIG
jgi:biotin carboxyl carrier protein